MCFLVTGGAGYIGSHLADSLIADGHHVIVIDNFSTGKHENIAHLDSNPRFELYDDTILNTELLGKIVPGLDGIYHLAAVVGVKNIVEKPLEGIITNVDGSHKVIEAASKHGVKILIASSSEVYGMSDRTPLSENDIRSPGPTHIPRWSYAVSKALDEHLALAYRMEKGLKCSIVRYFNSYGPRIDESGYGSVIARFISQALKGQPLTIYGNGTQTRSFTYVADTVRGTRLAFETESAEGLVFNIGNQIEFTINELAGLVEEAVGVNVGREQKSFEEIFGRDFQETPRRQPDISHARDVLGFVAEIDIRDGLNRTVEWARENYKSVIK
ncbi:MAG: GDP-mannose 4,6-dehydratase [bacterium]